MVIGVIALVEALVLLYKRPRIVRLGDHHPVGCDQVRAKAAEDIAVRRFDAITGAIDKVISRSPR